MSLAVLSVLALVVTVLISCFLPINVGVVAIVLAWLVGVYGAGLTVAQVMGGFPTQLFLTLVGVLLLFAQAEANGTLERIAGLAVKGCRGNLGLIPVVFFAMGLVLATIGPGNIASAALLAPLAMAVAAEVGIPAFLMALMVANGANAGSLSPLAPTGIIATDAMDRIGLGGMEWITYSYNMAAHAFVAFAGFALFGGLELFRQWHTEPVALSAEEGDTFTGEPLDRPTFEPRHKATMVVIGALIASVVFLGVNVGLGAFAGAALLTLVRAGDDTAAVKRMPWKVVLMVTGVTVLVSLLEETGGMDLFSALLARMATEDTITGAIAFVTGIISVYSSTSGVVLPAFLPTVPGLIERLGGGDAFAVASSINVGAHLVDVSSLSTIGAICVAAAAPSEDARALFNKMLAWGFSMSVVGALICWVAFGLL
jgi:Na+/H+ antiporter NhaD/arsenite permease-like protein